MGSLAHRGSSYEPDIPGGVAERLFLLLLAPLGEELLFRGLLEGYLLISLGGGNCSIAVVVPALLFSVTHYMRFTRHLPPT